MAYILLSEGCQGHQIKFLQENGEFLHKPIGRKYSGTLALQTFEDRNYMRITFADGKNVFFGAIKKFFGMTKSFYNESPIDGYKAGNADYLCHFDFSREDLRSGKKKITYSIQIVGFLAACVITCYDLKKGNGCCYMFANKDEAEKWAKKLELTEVEYLDMDGHIQSREPLT